MSNNTSRASSALRKISIRLRDLTDDHHEESKKIVKNDGLFQFDFMVECRIPPKYLDFDSDKVIKLKKSFNVLINKYNLAELNLTLNSYRGGCASCPCSLFITNTGLELFDEEVSPLWAEKFNLERINKLETQ